MRDAVVNTAPRFGHRYVLRGYAEQMKPLAKAAAEMGLPFAYAEAPNRLNWCIATGDKDVADLNAHVASRKPVYEDIQRQLRALVEDQILDVLTSRPEDTAPLALNESLSEIRPPAAAMLQRIQNLGLVQKSLALLHPMSSYRLKPICEWVEANYGIKADAAPCYTLNAHKAHQAYQRGRFDLATGQFSYETVAPQAAYQTVFRDIFGVTEKPRRLLASRMIPQCESLQDHVIKEGLAAQFPAAEPEQLQEHLRAMVRSGLLRPVSLMAEYEYEPTPAGLKAYKAFLHGKPSPFGTAPHPVAGPLAPIVP